MLNLQAILSLLSIPAVFFVVVVKTVVGIPAGVFHSMFAMVNMERFDLTPESNGRLLSYVGIITMVGRSVISSSQLIFYSLLSLSPTRPHPLPLCVDNARLWSRFLLQEIH